jgi:AcrR family transcriptional regulator
MEASARARRGRPPRPEQVARNRRALLDAAWDVFRDLGYSGAGLDLIADRAGFSKGAVYSHFRGKADLFLSLLEDQIAERASAQQALVPTLRSPADARRALVEIVERSRQDPAWRLALIEFRVVAARDRELNARYAAAHQASVAGVVEAMDQIYRLLGERPRRPLDQLATVAFALDTGGFLEDVACEGALPSEQVALLFMEIAGLSGEAVAGDGDGGKETS